MKHAFTILLVLWFSIASYAQVQSSCQIPWSLEQYYQKDVAYLTFNRLQEIHSPDTSWITIPQIHQDTVWNGLSAFFNATSIPQRDSIFDMYCLHQTIVYGTPTYPAIRVELDTSYPWTGHWLNNEITSGYDALDNLMSDYQFYIQSVIFNKKTVVLYSELPINPNPVVDSLLLFEGITNAYPDVVASNGNHIEYAKVGDEQFFDFTLAWGDCLSGCINHHTWQFKVNASTCEVTYLGIQSHTISEFPDPINCHITSVENAKYEPDDSLRIFPNPTSDFINIEGESISEIAIWNQFHQLQQFTCNKQNTSRVNLNNFPSGIYYMKITTEKMVVVRKIVVN